MSCEMRVNYIYMTEEYTIVSRMYAYVVPQSSATCICMPSVQVHNVPTHYTLPSFKTEGTIPCTCYTLML
jgi:hypothetical protein